jgi:hypothetical protein
MLLACHNQKVVEEKSERLLPIEKLTKTGASFRVRHSDNPRPAPSIFEGSMINEGQRRKF